MTFTVRESITLKKAKPCLEVEFDPEVWREMDPIKKKKITSYLKYLGFNWYFTLRYWGRLKLGQDAGEIEDGILQAVSC